MFASSHRGSARPPRRRSERRPATPRRGVALIFVMIFVVAMAALAMSSISMASGSTLLAKAYDRERDLRYAADAALAIGKARINGNPALLSLPAGVNYRQIITNEQLLGADNLPLPGVRINVYVGITGSSSGQNGRFASIVAQAMDERANYGFIRRLELTQESFAKYAYWTNLESNTTQTIYFNNGDEFWGPVWSNDVISINTGGAIFHDAVGTALTINGKQYGVFSKTPLENQAPIQLPSTTSLNVLPSYATVGNMNLTTRSAASTNEKLVLDRIEFLAFDIDGNKDSAGTDEGFFRWYQAGTGNEARLRGDWMATYDTYNNPATIPAATSVDRCGDWHYMPMAKDATGKQILSDTALKFYPASVHGQTWFHDQIMAGTAERGKLPAGFLTYQAYADAEKLLNTLQILSHANARCYMQGDPHLVAADRPLNGARGLPLNGTYTTADINKGGEDTTFTAVGRYGKWMTPTLVVPDTIVKLRPWDGLYLTPLGHTYNANGKGVIYASGNIGVSGVVNGLVTLYAKGDIVILDDLRYANDPVTGVCHDILGLISDLDIVVADNAINSPVPLSLNATATPAYNYRSMDKDTDLTFHGVAMALGTSFRVENYNLPPTTVNGCNGVPNARGCLYLSGGLIQKSRGSVSTSSGKGFLKRYTYDRCAVRNPPPYFPTTGRFTDNRYLELDPVGFNASAYFLSLLPTGP